MLWEEIPQPVGKGLCGRRGDRWRDGFNTSWFSRPEPRAAPNLRRPLCEEEEAFA